MKFVTLLFSAAGMLWLNLPSPYGDVNMSSSNIPLATCAQMEDYKTTNEFLLGIKANDPEKAIPLQKSKSKWSMLTSEKRNVAGLFNRFGSEPEPDDANDWNFMIDPLDPFKYVYDYALKNPDKTLSEWWGCIDYADQRVRCSSGDYNGHHCYFAEISPYNRFLNNNRWFQRSDNNHCKEGEFLKWGDTLGIYGFPVIDEAHGYNPEIHPAQQLWFRNRGKSNKDKNSYFLMFIQDASDRFGNWTRSPIYGQFLIPFRAKPSAISPRFYTPLTMNISIAEKYDLVTKSFPDYSTDADDGNSHALVVDGKKLVIVNEPLADDDNKSLGIRFTDICKLPDGTIQGYVQVSMVLGDYDTDPIGVCVLELEVVKAKSGVVSKPRTE